jgi:hypothetical protein
MIHGNVVRDPTTFSCKIGSQDFSLAAGIIHDPVSQPHILKEVCKAFMSYVTIYEANLHACDKIWNLGNVDEACYEKIYKVSKMFAAMGKDELAMNNNLQSFCLKNRKLELPIMLLNRSTAQLMVKQYYDAALSAIVSVMISNHVSPKALYRLVKGLLGCEMLEEANRMSELSVKCCPGNEGQALREQLQEIRALRSASSSSKKKKSGGL